MNAVRKMMINMGLIDDNESVHNRRIIAMIAQHATLRSKWSAL